jgi:hypothetical protein
VFGSGSISFEMLRALTERLPAMVCPRWVRTRIQPIARRDLLTYLEQSLHVAPGIYEIGGADVTTYREMISDYAKVRGLRPRRIVDIPLLTPHLSSYWVDLVTPVDSSISHSLIESLVTEVVVTDPGPAAQAFSVDPIGVQAALAAALDEQEEEIGHALFDLQNGLKDGVYSVVVEVAVPEGFDEALARDLVRIGGSLAWYGAAWGWALRLLLGRLFGEHLGRRRPDAVASGELVDWWRIVRSRPGELVLRGVGWFPGDAWLGYRVGQGSLRQVAAFRPRGIPGFLYWKVLHPVHHLAFDRMARHRIRRARVADSQPGVLFLMECGVGPRHALDAKRSICDRSNHHLHPHRRGSGLSHVLPSPRGPGVCRYGRCPRGDTGYLLGRSDPRHLPGFPRRRTADTRRIGRAG